MPLQPKVQAPNPYPHDKLDGTAQLRMQVAEMMRSRQARPIFLAGTYNKPIVPQDACATIITEGRRPYNIQAIMGRSRANDASPLLANPSDGVVRMAAAASPAPRNPLTTRGMTLAI